VRYSQTTAWYLEGQGSSFTHSRRSHLVHFVHRISRRRSQAKLIVGVSGPIAAGKTTGCRYLERGGFYYARFSAVIDELLRQRGAPIDRSHQQELGVEVNRRRGQQWLCRRLMKRVPHDTRLLVIDGLRFLEDHSFFQNQFGCRFLHLHIAAPSAIRRARYLHAGGTAEDFASAESAFTESQHDRMASLAHAIVENQLDLSYLSSQVDRVVNPVLSNMGRLRCQ
jgi:dephospho-CoA kinase